MGVMSSTVKGTHQRASSGAGYSHMDTATGVGSRTREVTELLQSLETFLLGFSVSMQICDHHCCGP